MQLSDYQRLERLALFARRRPFRRRKNRARRAAIYGGVGLGLLGAGVGATYLLRKKSRSKSRDSSIGPDIKAVENHKKKVKAELDAALEKQRRYHQKTMKRINKLSNPPKNSRKSQEDFERKLNDPNYVWRF
jgi:hypothetical protein